MSALQLTRGFRCTNCSHYVNIIIVAIFLHNPAPPHRKGEEGSLNMPLRSSQGREQGVQLIWEQLLPELDGATQVINSL